MDTVFFVCLYFVGTHLKFHIRHAYSILFLYSIRKKRNTLIKNVWGSLLTGNGCSASGQKIRWLFESIIVDSLLCADLLHRLVSPRACNHNNWVRNYVDIWDTIVVWISRVIYLLLSSFFSLLCIEFLATPKKKYLQSTTIIACIFHFEWNNEIKKEIYINSRCEIWSTRQNHDR